MKTLVAGVASRVLSTCLGERLLPKPEGITFLANGDLVLSSEGKGRTPVVVRYAMKSE